MKLIYSNNKKTKPHQYFVASDGQIFAILPASVEVLVRKQKKSKALKKFVIDKISDYQYDSKGNLLDKKGRVCIELGLDTKNNRKLNILFLYDTFEEALNKLSEIDNK